jgi:hypothetical protein
MSTIIGLYCALRSSFGPRSDPFYTWVKRKPPPPRDAVWTTF